MSPSLEIIPGSFDSSVIIHVPHASRVIPDNVRAEIVLDDEELERELDAMTDAYTDIIAQRVADAAGVRPWLVINRLSRLVVDPERFPDQREELNAVGMGAVYSHTSRGQVLRALPLDEISDLVDRFFSPYAEVLAGLVDTRLDFRGHVTIIDLHSYPLEPNPYELHDGPRPEICLGTDTFHTPSFFVGAATRAFANFSVDTNTPFAGCYVPMKHYRTNDRVTALMLEVRRDLYMNDDFTLATASLDPIVAAITTLLDDFALQNPPFLCSAVNMMLPYGDFSQDEIVLSLGGHMPTGIGDIADHIEAVLRPDDEELA